MKSEHPCRCAITQPLKGLSHALQTGVSEDSVRSHPAAPNALSLGSQTCSGSPGQAAGALRTREGTFTGIRMGKEKPLCPGPLLDYLYPPPNLSIFSRPRPLAQSPVLAVPSSQLHSYAPRATSPRRASSPAPPPPRRPRSYPQPLPRPLPSAPLLGLSSFPSPPLRHPPWPGSPSPA